MKPRRPAFFICKRGSARAHDHVVFSFESGARVVYNDPRRFGFMLLEPHETLSRHPLFAGLGVEPLARDMNAKALATAFYGRKTPVKSALLDQRVIAGLGNIYVCEALHRAGLSPRCARPAVLSQRLEGQARRWND